MLEYLFFPVLTIAFMAFCLAKCENVLCKIVAAIFIFSAVMQSLLYMNLMPEFVLPYLDYLMRASVIATAIFIFQLFRTASEVRTRGEEGANYNFIIGAALLFMMLISFDEVRVYLDNEWFYRLRMRIWPELAVLITVIVMKVKKVVLNKDEDLLLWYFAGSSLFVLGYYFL
jgi:hypothetical protein